MAKQIPARRKGDTYQARFFWSKLLELRTNTYIKSVTFESDEVPFVDDVVVSYIEPIKDQLTGKPVVRDLFQCKHHMTPCNAFTLENLIDPSFIKCKESMLKRLYDAYLRLSNELGPDAFRLCIFSNWHWDHRDVLSEYLQEEEMIRETFYEKGPRSIRGKERIKLVDHLGISKEEDLRAFLDTIRFTLGKKLNDLTNSLNILFERENLKQIDLTVSHNIYDDLAWKLLEQGRHSFNKQSLKELIQEEKLSIPLSTEYSEISIRSFSQFTRLQHDPQGLHLDLCSLFDGRFPIDDSYWEEEIPEQVSAFMLNRDLSNVPQPIHISFDCHLSIAFLAGSITSPKHRIQIIPTQNAELWEPSEIHTDTTLWNFRTIRKIEKELILGISVTHQVQKEMEPYLEAQGLSDLPRILVCPIGGIGPKAISGGDHAWQLGYQLAKQLSEMLPYTCCKIHLFFAGPIAMGYILGHTLRNLTPLIQMYEFDIEFERQHQGQRYYPSLRPSYQT